jgi:peroxin-5
MAAKNPISNLVDAILDNRGSGRGQMGMGMGAGPAQMAQMERAFAEGQSMARGGRMNMAAMGPSMMNTQGQAFVNDFAGGAVMQPRAGGSWADEFQAGPMAAAPAHFEQIFQQQKMQQMAQMEAAWEAQKMEQIWAQEQQQMEAAWQEQAVVQNMQQQQQQANMAQAWANSAPAMEQAWQNSAPQMDAAWAASQAPLEAAWAASQGPLDAAWAQSQAPLDAAWAESQAPLEAAWQESNPLETAWQDSAALETAWADSDELLQAWEASNANLESAWADATAAPSYLFDQENPFLGAADAFEQGLALFEQGKLKQAILAFEAVVQQDQTHADGWRMLGQSHAENDEDRKAISCLQRAVEEDPYNLDALLALGVSYVNELDSQRALNTLKAWVEHNPQFEGLEFKADEYSDGTLMDEVMQLMVAAAKQAEGQSVADVQVVLGVLYNVSRDYDAAAECFRIACAASDQDYTLWNKLGATQANGSMSEEAIPAYHKALELKPKYARGWLNLGISHANLGNYNEGAWQPATRCRKTHIVA